MKGEGHESLLVLDSDVIFAYGKGKGKGTGKGTGKG